MSYQKLLSPERRDFVRKVYAEIHSNAFSAITDRENGKVYFLQLVNGNKQLSEKEKGVILQYDPPSATSPNSMPEMLHHLCLSQLRSEHCARRKAGI